MIASNKSLRATIIALTSWAAAGCSASGASQYDNAYGAGGLEDPATTQVESQEAALCSAPQAPPRQVLAPDHVASVAIELSETDWESMRYEGKSLFDNFIDDVSKFAPFPYRKYPASVKVDGVRYETSLQKTGFLGGVSALRPSLKLEFGNGSHALNKGVLRRMVLNNDLEDPSHTRECLAYDLFTRAGYPAPRCSYARVTINGRDVGTYTHVQAIDETFLEEHFGNSNGPLYRAEIADFDPVTERFVFNSTRVASRRPLDRLIKALNAPDEQLVGRLSQVLDIEQFREFWALETLLGNWDGYSNASNNFFAYYDTTQKRFVFLPWGADQAFVGSVPWLVGFETTVYYKAKITNRLYQIPEQRAAFRTRLAELNDTVWDTSWLLRRIDERAELTDAGDPAALESLREYVRARGQELRLALSEPAPEVPRFTPFQPPTPSDACAQRLAEIHGHFSVPYASNPYAALPGDGQFEITSTVDGEPYAGEFFGLFGPNPILEDYSSLLAATDLPNGTRIGFSFVLPNELYTEGVHPFHSWETLGIGVIIGPGDLNLIDFGYISDGEITLEQVSRELGGTVSGSFRGKLYPFGCLNSSGQ